jgi:hypothetical protein
MTPFTYTTNDMHIDVYLNEVRVAMSQPRTHPAVIRSLRRHIARGLVRTGAWLLPDKPEVIGGTVFVLPKAPNNSADRKAA